MIPILAFGQQSANQPSIDTLMVSIYPQSIDGNTQYLRVSDYPIEYKNGLIYSHGAIYSGFYGEYYPCTKIAGKLKRMGTIKNGKPEGVFKGYYENGVLAIEENYHDGVLQSKPIYYDSKGMILKGKESIFKPLVKETYWRQKSSGYGGC
jgi:antitoxin component YwqK of YwqJK toxin-antitoxin module